MNRTFYRLMSVLVALALSLSLFALAEAPIEAPVNEIAGEIIAAQGVKAAPEVADGAVSEGEVEIAEKIVADNALVMDDYIFVDMDDPSVYGDPKKVAIDHGTTAVLQKNASKQLKAIVYPTNAATDFTWKSSKSSVVSVTADGVVTAKKVGSAKITVTTTNGKKASITIKVVDRQNPTKIKFAKKSMTIYMYRGSYDLSDLVIPTYRGDAPEGQLSLKWSSGNKSIVKVDQNGVITGLKIGTAKITAKTTNKKTASITIKVSNYENPKAVQFKKESIALYLGGNAVNLSDLLNLTYVKGIKTENPATGLAWKSNRHEVATVDQNGIVTALKAGNAEITVTARNRKTATIDVTVIDNINPSKLSFTKKSAKLHLDEGSLDLNKLLKVEYPDGKPSNPRPLTWKSNDFDVYVIDGIVEATEEGTAIITVTAENGKTASIVVDIVE